MLKRSDRSQWAFCLGAIMLVLAFLCGALFFATLQQPFPPKPAGMVWVTGFAAVMAVTAFVMAVLAWLRAIEWANGSSASSSSPLWTPASSSSPPWTPSIPSSTNRFGWLSGLRSRIAGPLSLKLLFFVGLVLIAIGMAFNAWLEAIFVAAGSFCVGIAFSVWCSKLDWGSMGLLALLWLYFLGIGISGMICTNTSHCETQFCAFLVRIDGLNRWAPVYMAIGFSLLGSLAPAPFIRRSQQRNRP